MHAEKLLEQVKSIPNCLNAPWLVSWCMKDSPVEGEEGNPEEEEKADGINYGSKNLFDQGDEVMAGADSNTGVAKKEQEVDKDGIRHFFFQFINTEKIGPCKDHNQRCGQDASTIELLLGNKIKTILV